MFRLFRLDLKLRPPQGWAAVRWELGIVTLGVLLALGAQQAVEAISWQGRAIDAKVRLLVEMRRHYDIAYEIVAVAPCVDRQLNDLADKINEPGGRVMVYTEPDIGTYVYRSPDRSIATDVWLAAISEGVTSHLDHDFARLTSTHYGQIALFQAASAEARPVELRLAVLKRNMPLDLRERFEVTRDVEALREYSGLKRLIARQIVDRLNDAGYTSSDRYLREWLPHSRTANFCKARGLPLDTAASPPRKS